MGNGLRGDHFMALAGISWPPLHIFASADCHVSDLRIVTLCWSKVQVAVWGSLWSLQQKTPWTTLR